MRSYPRLISAAMAICLFTLSCKKKEKSHIDLGNFLGKWKMQKVATDLNKNDQLDAEEISEWHDPIFNHVLCLRDCEMGAIYYKYDDETTGKITNTEISFKWTLINNGYAIRVQSTCPVVADSIIHVYSVSPTELITKSKGSDPQPITRWVIYSRVTHW